MQKLTTLQLIATLKDLEGPYGFHGIITGVLMYRADPKFWDALLDDWGASLDDAAITECQSWMDQRTQLIRDNWAGSPPTPEKSNRVSGLNYYASLASLYWLNLHLNIEKWWRWSSARRRVSPLWARARWELGLDRNKDGQRHG